VHWDEGVQARDIGGDEGDTKPPPAALKPKPRPTKQPVYFSDSDSETEAERSQRLHRLQQRRRSETQRESAGPPPPLESAYPLEAQSAASGRADPALASGSGAGSQATQPAPAAASQQEVSTAPTAAASTAAADVAGIETRVRALVPASTAQRYDAGDYRRQGAGLTADDAMGVFNQSASRSGLEQLGLETSDLLSRSASVREQAHAQVWSSLLPTHTNRHSPF
jgi:hypothetical protein